jgi:aminopeptidase N
MMTSTALRRLLPSLSLLVSSGALGDSIQPDRRGHAVPDRVFDIESLVLDLELDPDEESVEGSATYEIRRLGVGDLVLDQVDLEVSGVQVNGEDGVWWIEGHHLHITVESDRASVRIDYRAEPDTGLHFRHARRDTVDSYDEIWSQGQKNDNRYWIPCWDHPNDRFVYEGNIRAPEGWSVLTNSGVELPSYLIMVAAGDYEIHTHDEDETVSVWVGPGTSAEAIEGVLGPIPAMKEHFAMRSGVDYPWGPYRQVFAQRFLYGGMENTSATINSDRFLVSRQLQETRMGVESVVAHELAHQWYGDLLTCRTWRELWLNEGFATFMAGDWMATHHGPEHYARAVQRWLDNSQRPGSLAGRFHQGPDAGWSYNVYSKGASVLHMLRVLLGEEVFWKGIEQYTQTHAGGVDTYDFRRVMEEVSGQHLDWFFQQWTELPHVPEVQVSHSFSEGTLSVTVVQNTTDEIPLYSLPIDLEIGTGEGPQRLEGWLEDSRLVLTIELDEAPLYVAFDPDGGVLAKIEHAQDPEHWVEQLKTAAPYARLRAIDALADTDRSEEIAAILLDDDEHVEFRIRAAASLGEQRASDELIAALHVDSARVREAVASGLGQCSGDQVSAALVELVRRDDQPDVVSRALTGLSKVDPDRALKLARARISIRAPEKLGIRDAAAGVLGDHGEPADLGLLLDTKAPVRTRHHALWNAVDLVKRQDDDVVRAKLASRSARFAETMLEDDDLRARSTAVYVLARVGDSESIPVLEKYRRQEGALRLQDSITEALSDIRSRDGAAPKLSPNELEGRIEALEGRMDEIEAENKLR